jgi:hypothetical protein
MPSKSELAIATRTIEVMKVLQLTFEGVSQKDACIQVGISADTFRRWINDDIDVIQSLQIAQLESERQRYIELSQAHTVIIGKLINWAVNLSVLDAETLLKIAKYLDEKLAALDKKLGVSNTSIDANKFLDGMQGPTLIVEDSKMQEIENAKTKINVKALDDGSIDVEIPRPTRVIDIDPDVFGN